ncbi:MAG: hypothetical protein LH472_04450 [Pyrinomonadaceae bacterium]|nr:hypothetical protein [Pyrinomonadaceae bacterium]
MQTTQTTDETLNISREKLVSLVSQMFGGASGNPNPDEPHQPGPWDPIIRKVSNRFFGPFPEPWRMIFGNHSETRHSELGVNRVILKLLAALRPEIFDVIGGGHHFSRAAAELNPQPLPPRAAFLAAFAQEVIDRAALMQEIADAMNQAGEERGIIIVSGYLSRFVDDLCPEPIKIKIPPKPKSDTDDRLSGLELIITGAVFEQNAALAANQDLRRELSNAGAKLMETGIARM